MLKGLNTPAAPPEIDDIFIDPIILEYFRFECYYNLTKKSKKKSMLFQRNH